MRHSHWLSLACALLLCACSGMATLRQGTSTSADVQRAMGVPTLRWQDADGTSHWAYVRGPEGYKTLLVDFDANGKLRGVENVLDEAHFATIKPGMTKQQVLHRLGPPQPQWTTYYKARDELVWEWRFCDAWNSAARFDVLFDATEGTVRSSFDRREECGLTKCLCAH
jgi:hypothetical protein